MKKVEDYKFPDDYKNIAEKYIMYKRSLGFKFSVHDQIKLNSLLSYIYSHIIDSNLQLSQDLVEFIAKRNGTESISYLHGRQSLIRQFALFLNLQGITAYVYPKSLVKTSADFIPYIYTHDEILEILKVSDSIKSKPQGYKNSYMIFPAIFRMLYGCGLRVGEAVALTKNNVDLENGIITVMNGKNNVSRLVPMSNSLKKYLIEYDSKVKRKENPFFFPARRNEQYATCSIRNKFIIVEKAAGIQQISTGKHPRLHDLRHTFSVHALEKMIKEGQDVYCSLPILSVYLGHKGIESTEKYLRLTKQYFQDVLKMNAVDAEKIFPEVEIYEK